MRRRFAVALVALGLLVPVAPARGGTADIGIHDNYYSPDARRVAVGDSVRWFRAGDSNGFHNVREDGRLFWSGRSTGGPIDYRVVFSAGTFHYYCSTHGYPLEVDDEGMEGFVRVPVSISRLPSGLPFTVRWATDGAETGTAYDVQFRVGSGAWRTWKKDVTNNKGEFGRNAKPVRVRDGARYSFRARSQDGPNASGWSPVASLTA
jgi:plastocyanin